MEAAHLAFPVVIALAFAALPARADDAPICFPLPSNHRVIIEVEDGSGVGLAEALACLAGLLPDRRPGLRDCAVTLHRDVPVRLPLAMADAAAALSKSCLKIEKKGRRLVIASKRGRNCPSVEPRPVRTELPSGGKEAVVTTRPAAIPPRSILAEPERVKDLGDSRYRLSRDLKTLVLLDPMAFVGEGAAFPLPFRWPAAGFLVSWIRTGGVLERMGLRTGDIVTTVNGLPLASVDDAFFAYNALRDADVIVLSLLRTGLVHTFVYEFEHGEP